MTVLAPSEAKQLQLMKSRGINESERGTWRWGSDKFAPGRFRRKKKRWRAVIRREVRFYCLFSSVVCSSCTKSCLILILKQRAFGHAVHIRTLGNDTCPGSSPPHINTLHTDIWLSTVDLIRLDVKFCENLPVNYASSGHCLVIRLQFG